MVTNQLPATTGNVLMDMALEKERFPGSAPMPFSCQGCGHNCCVGQTILLTPPEAARILWYMRRNRIDAGAWAGSFLGGSTGFPVLQLEMEPLNPDDPNSPEVCPFLRFVPDPDGQRIRLALCAIREVRPSVCRIYPVGRLTSIRNEETVVEYFFASQCQGFELPAHGQAVPIGYLRPDPNQTVEDWVCSQTDPEQEEEKNFYVFDVLREFLDAHIHAPMGESRDGILNERQALELGRMFIYNIPAAPKNPADDHKFIMAWLRLLKSLTVNFPGDSHVQAGG
jgi:Fe-S-cluster containining protein